ncbi:MAG: hypothetical protein AAFV85_14945 [Cyanobacteria bacterium J06634_6]
MSPFILATHVKDIDRMAPRKLSDSDKTEIVDLYRQPGQTTSTLAEQYGVSNSTISRILKSSIPSEEYSELISQKRMAGADSKSDSAGKKTRQRRTKQTAPKADSVAESKADSAPVIEATPAVPEFEPAKNQPTADGNLEGAASEEPNDSAPPTRRRRRRSNAKGTTENESTQLPLLDTEDATDEATEDVSKESLASGRPKPVLANARADDRTDDDEDDDDEDDLVGLDETLSDDFGDDDDLDEEEEEDDDEIEIKPPKLRQPADALFIMPLAEAVLPKPCYLVVDTRAELITRPLVEFSDLGDIPSSEEKSNTLPVFDNHRVARRFSRNKQRVIKVPDGNLITRTSPYLKAKGITRLLVDGQVFDLVGAE